MSAQARDYVPILLCGREPLKLQPQVGSQAQAPFSGARAQRSDSRLGDVSYLNQCHPLMICNECAACETPPLGPGKEVDRLLNCW
jgi:hypothetical protein